MTGADTTLTFDEVIRNQMPSYEGKETISMSVMDCFVENFDKIQSVHHFIMDDTKGTLTTEQIKTSLKKYRVNRRQGKKITYRFAKNRKNGRLFSQTLSGQGMPRAIRHTLFRDEYIDIDIVNCHPVILSWYCSQMGWVSTHIDNYILHRDDIIKNIMTDFSLSKDYVKNIFLKVLNGGELDPLVWSHPFCENFRSEIKQILENVEKSATDEENKLKKKDNLAGSILNHRLCCIENYILKMMVEFFEGHNFKNLILCFDGLMIHKSAEPLLTDLQSRLDLLRIPHLKVVIKPMNEHIDMSGFIQTTDLPINPPFDFDPDYNINDFELEFAGKSFSSMNEFKSLVIPKYCKVFAHFRDFPQPVYRTQDNKFTFGWCNTDYYMWMVDGKKISLMDIVRLFPQHIPRYENYEFCPNGFNVFGEPCPSSILNNWSGFKASELDEFDYHKIEPILHHLKTMWADDDLLIYEYLLDYFASIVQFPWKRTQVLLLLYSKPRAGKNIITNFFLNKVIGLDYGSDNIGIDVLTCRFNETLLQQIFVVLNELPELTPQTRKGIFDTIKQAITENIRQYEIKGGRKWQGPNFANCICTTNHDFTYHIEEDDGRILPISCSNRYIGNFDYFTSLGKFLQQDNADHFLTYLLKRNITHDLRQIPMTKLKLQMIEQSLPSPSRFIRYIRDTPNTISDLIESLYSENLSKRNIINDNISKGFINSSHLYSLYDCWCRQTGENRMSHTSTSLHWKNHCNLTHFKHKFYGVCFNIFWQT